MMKRIARAVHHICPTDAIAMLKETSLASGMVMERIDTHVTKMIVSKLVVVRLRMNDVMHCVLDVGENKKINKTMFQIIHVSAELFHFNKK